jgi:opacity protein-like surface antigen
MKYLVLAVVTALVAGSAATAAHAENPSVPAVASAARGSDAGSLNTLLAEWDRAAFNPPSKPSQYRVFGRNGYVTSGPGYNAMIASIRSAVADAAAGHDRAETLDIAKARSLLTSVAPTGAVQIGGKV